MQWIQTICACMTSANILPLAQHSGEIGSMSGAVHQRLLTHSCTRHCHSVSLNINSLHPLFTNLQQTSECQYCHSVSLNTNSLLPLFTNLHQFIRVPAWSQCQSKHWLPSLSLQTFISSSECHHCHSVSLNTDSLPSFHKPSSVPQSASTVTVSV